MNLFNIVKTGENHETQKNTIINSKYLNINRASQVKNLPANVGDAVQSLGREDPLQMEMTTHSSILAWKIPWRSLAGFSPQGCKELDRTEQLSTHTDNNILKHHKYILKISKISLNMCTGKSLNVV